ncbi:MAG: YceI family protein [Melioribacteraceae bacterium]|nr:YceI family protein [Melioribacteraceae bacterium]
MNKRIALLLIVLFIPVMLHSEEWQVKKSEDNLVKFTSSTPVLDFDGITSKIDGYIYWEGEEIFGNNNEIYFEVDLNSVETGIGKRDRDMREDVLHTDKWPKTSYRGKIQSYTQSENDSSVYKVVSSGKMFLHGKEKAMTVNAEIAIKNNLMNVTCDYSVFLKDYDIEAPSLLAFIKVADEIKLHLDFQLIKVSEDN